MEIETIDVPITLDGYDGQSAQIRKKRSWAAAKNIESKSLVFRRPDAGATPETGARMNGVIDLVEQGVAVLEHAIVSWTLEPPPTRAYFLSDDFDELLGDFLTGFINGYYEGTAKSGAERLA